MMTERKFLWTVTDPRGLTISLAEAVWQEHLGRHREITGYFEEMKLTAQDPDEIYFDASSSSRKSPGTLVHWYYRLGLTRGIHAGNYIAVIVKAVLEPDGVRRGYVQSAFIPHETEGRLILEWSKSK